MLRLRRSNQGVTPEGLHGGSTSGANLFQDETGGWIEHRASSIEDRGVWRRRPDSNRGIRALQAPALPLGHVAWKADLMVTADGGQERPDAHENLCYEPKSELKARPSAGRI